MFRLEKFTKSYGINPLFKNISFHINEGDKIALIAKNGVGKSTLLRILGGEETWKQANYLYIKMLQLLCLNKTPSLMKVKRLENIFHTNHPV
jgi:ATP-binding cassette subfamily F protein uup